MKRYQKTGIVRRRGFSLIESLIAIFILAVGVLAIVELFSSSASQAIDTGKSLTALGLAQEGVELMRTLKNDNLVAGGDIFDGIDASDSCRVGITSPTPVSVAFECSSLYSGNDYKLAVSSPYYYQINPASINAQFPPLWRRIYVENANAGGIEKRAVASVVFYREPIASDWPNNMNDVETQCTVQKQCVFFKALLQ